MLTARTYPPELPEGWAWDWYEDRDFLPARRHTITRKASGPRGATLRLSVVRGKLWEASAEVRQPMRMRVTAMGKTETGDPFSGAVLVAETIANAGKAGRFPVRTARPMPLPGEGS